MNKWLLRCFKVSSLRFLTAEAALRDALEGTKNVAGAHGIFNMSPTDHLGLDQRARVMVRIENGQWKYQP